MDTKTIFIMFDCPLETCDKLWLFDVIAKEAEADNTKVKIVPFPYKRSYADMLLFGKHKKLNRIAILSGILFQSLYVRIRKKSDDVVIVWGFLQGIIGNIVLSLCSKAKVISLNWLMPPGRQSWWWIPIRKVISSQGFLAVTNNREAKEKWINAGGKQFEKMRIVNDVYNNRIKFSNRECAEERYCFTGGMNNRDWKIVLSLAEKYPSILFKCVAQKNDWEREAEGKELSNIQVYFELPEKEYYEMLDKSYIVLLPLRENKTSGLINIIRAMQKGILVITSKFSFTELYFYDPNCIFLVSQKEGYEKALLKLWNMNEKEYHEKAEKNAAFLKENFSPEKIGKRIYNFTGGI